MPLKPGEKIEDLQNGFAIIQNPSFFAFGTDAVLLSAFTEVFADEHVVDLGTGCGIIPILLHAKQPAARITGIEVQPPIADMAQRSVSLNALDARIRIVCADLKNARDHVAHGVDAVVCNPPYERVNAGMDNANAFLNIAKREVLCTLKDVIAAAASLLRTGGRLTMIYRTERFAELMDVLRAYHLEPKRIQLVAPHADKAPNFALVEARAGARSGVKFLPTLAVYEPDGSYTPALKKIYHIGEEKPCSISWPHP